MQVQPLSTVFCVPLLCNEIPCAFAYPVTIIWSDFLRMCIAKHCCLGVVRVHLSLPTMWLWHKCSYAAKGLFRAT